jgi:hypothetical protein
MKKLFGPDVLEQYLEDFRRCYRLTFTLWKSVNLQPGKNPSKLGICPHYELISLCAEIVGVKPEIISSFNYFCGIFRKDVMVTDHAGTRSQVGGVEETPFRCCAAVAAIMSMAIIYAKSPAPKGIKEISDDPSEDEQRRIKEYLQKHAEFKSGQEVLKHLRGTVFRVVQMAEKNRTDEGLISRVENLRDSLSSFGSNDSVVFNGSCEIGPKHKRNQWLCMD